jgi:hypothetical protein
MLVPVTAIPATSVPVPDATVTWALPLAVVVLITAGAAPMSVPPLIVN